MSLMRRLTAVPDLPAPPAPPGPREALAAAVAVSKAATEAADKVRASVRFAETLRSEAEARHAAAVEAINAARASHAAGIVAAATAGEAAPASSDLRQARQAEAEANDDIEAAREAVATVRAPLADAEVTERQARETAKAAAVEVIYAEIPDLTREALDAYAAFLSKAAVLRGAVEATEAYHSAHYASESAERQAVRVDAQKVYMGLVANRDVLQGHGQDALWREAFAALQGDAAALLPA